MLSAEANGQVLKVTVKNILIAEFQYVFLYYLFVSYSGYVTLALMVLHTLLLTAVKRQILTIFIFCMLTILISACVHVVEMLHTS